MSQQLPRLLADLRDDDIYARRRAARDLAVVLSSVRDPLAIPALLDAVRDTDYYVRKYAAEALGAVGDTRVVPQLTQAAIDADLRVRTAAIGAMARLGDNKATRTLIHVLRGETPGDAGEAARYLGYTRDLSVIPELLDQLWRVDGYVRAMLVESLGQLGDPYVIPWLIEQRASDAAFVEPGIMYAAPPRISTLAAEALHNIGTQHALDALENWQDVTLSSVYYPKELAPGTWKPMLLYIFRGKAADDVAADVREQLKSSATEYRKHAETLAPPLSEGDVITVQPKVSGFEFNPTTAVIRLLEDWHRIPFRVRALGEVLNQAANGVITIMANALILGDVPISMFVSTDITDEPMMRKSVSRCYQAVFCSYSHKDSQIVRRIEKAYQALGLNYLRDLTTLRSGERWNDRLFELIEAADIFQLFWSAFAAESAYVEKEWRYALKLRREHFIRPVRWRDPIEPAPPSELQDVHFAYVPELADVGR